MSFVSCGIAVIDRWREGGGGEREREREGGKGKGGGEGASFSGPCCRS